MMAGGLGSEGGGGGVKAVMLFVFHVLIKTFPVAD